MKIIIACEMYNELKRLGYDMSNFLENKPIVTPVNLKLKEDLKTLKKRYPLVPESKLISLQSKYGAIMTNEILKEDYKLYEKAMEMGFPSLEQKEKCPFCEKSCGNKHCAYNKGE